MLIVQRRSERNGAYSSPLFSQLVENPLSLDTASRSHTRLDDVKHGYIRLEGSPVSLHRPSRLLDISLLIGQLFLKRCTVTPGFFFSTRQFAFDFFFNYFFFYLHLNNGFNWPVVKSYDHPL